VTDEVGAAEDVEMDRLIGLLDARLTSAQRAPYGIDIVYRQWRPVRVVLTPAELDDMAVIGLGSADAVADYVVELLAVMPARARYLVYSQYVLEASEVPTRPSIADHLAGLEPGEWVTERPGARRVRRGPRR